MKYIKIYFILCILLPFGAKAQNLAWVKQIKSNLGSEGVSVATDAQGYVYTLGSFNDTAIFSGVNNNNVLVSSGSQDIYISKHDDAGNLVWVKHIGGNQGTQFIALSMKLDANANIVIVGSIYGTADFDPGAPVYELSGGYPYGADFILKLNSSGNFIWATNSIHGLVPGAYVDHDFIRFTIDNNNDIIFSGEETGNGGGVFLAKYSSGGVFLWEISLSSGNNSVATDSYNNIYVVGGGSLYVGTSGCLISKYNANGNFLLNKYIQNTGAVYSCTIDQFDNLIIVGYYNGTVDFNPSINQDFFQTAFNPSVFIVKFDNQNNFKWVKSIYGSAWSPGYTVNPNVNSIATDLKGNIFFTGNFFQTIDFAPDVYQYNITSKGQSDFYFEKIDSSGNFLWARGIGGTFYEGSNSIAVNNYGDVYLTGYYTDTTDFDPNAGVYLLTDDIGDGADTYILKIGQCIITGFNPLVDTMRICADSVTLDAGPGFSTYNWSNGATTQTTVSYNTGLIKVAVSNAQGCIASDSSFVSILKSNIIQNNSSVCLGNNITLNIDSVFSFGNVCSKNSLSSSLQNGLVGYWPFCGNSNDVTLNANNGIVNGASLTTDRFVNTNSAYLFNGVSDYIEVPSSASISVTNAYTISAWFSANQWSFNSPIDQHAIVSKVVDGSWYGGYEIFIGGNNGWIQHVGNIGSNFSVGSTGGISNKWYNVVVTYDGNIVRYYLDGNKLDSIYLPGSIGVSSTPLRFGRRGGAGTYNSWFSGKIDDISIYNRSLSSSEIKQLYLSTPTITWSTGAITNSIIATPSQTTTYYATVSNGISSCTDSVKIQVTPIQIPNFSSITTTVCNGASFVLPTTSSNGIIGSWSPSINNTTTTTYTFTPNPGQCSSSSQQTIIVNQNSTISLSSAASTNAQTLCLNSAIVNINYAIAGGGTGAVITGLPAGVSGVYNSGTRSFVISGSPSAAGTFNYTITTSGPCTNASLGGTITVNAPSSLSLTPSSNSNQTICINSPISPIVYNVGGSATGASITGLPNGVIGVFNNGVYTISGSSTVVGNYNYTITSTGPCNAVSSNGTLQITPLTLPSFTQIPAICTGSTISLLTTSSNGITGNWSPAINNTATTTYTFTPDNGQCAATNTMTVVVNSKTDPEFSNVPALCNGGIVPSLPNTSNNGITGSWTPSVINNTAANTYTFTPSVNECATPKSITTVVIPNPYSNIRYPTVNAVQNQDYQLQARALQNANYLWTPSSGLSNASIVNPVFNYNRQQQYNIKITTAEGCVINDTILVRMYQNCEIYVPGGFSPNGDGINDLLFPELVGIAQLKYFKIFDRWGQMIFQTSISGNGWDGRYKGVKQPFETYLWIVEGVDVNGNVIKKNGSTILMR